MEMTLVAMPEKKVCCADFELDFGRFQSVSQTAGASCKVSYWLCEPVEQRTPLGEVFSG